MNLHKTHFKKLSHYFSILYSIIFKQSKHYRALSHKTLSERSAHSWGVDGFGMFLWKKSINAALPQPEKQNIINIVRYRSSNCCDTYTHCLLHWTYLYRGVKTIILKFL